jgi:hypothetical protein
MQCPNCQHWNEPGSRFCEECGFELPATGGTNQVSVRSTAVQPSVEAEAPDAVDFSEFVDKASVSPVPPSGSVSSVPPVPDQQLTPIDSPPPAPYTGPRLVLNSSGSIFRLGNAAVIGREDPTLQIDLEGYPDGKFVSHRHAQIVKMSDQYYIEDLGSSNHTYVNDIKLAEGQSEPLKQGDNIRLGKIVLTFHEG